MLAARWPGSRKSVCHLCGRRRTGAKGSVGVWPPVPVLACVGCSPRGVALPHPCASGAAAGLAATASPIFPHRDDLAVVPGVVTAS